MSNPVGVARLICLVACLALTGCLSSGTTDTENNSDSSDAASQEDASTQEDADRDDTGQTMDTGSVEDTGSQEDTGGVEDTGGTEDAGAQDTNPDDTGSQQDTGDQDTGNPFQNPCEDGPLDEPIENCSPTPLPSTGDPREDCVRRINQFRWECQCLPPLERWHEGEQCADEQAAYDEENNSPHAGFQQGICSPRGSAQNECPGYGTWDRVIGLCMQQMWDEGPGQPFEDHGHYINMSSTSYSMVACGGSDSWFVQNFR